MQPEKSLQKLTDSAGKIAALLEREKITKEDLKSLSPDEVQMFSKIVDEQYNALTGLEKEAYFRKIEAVVDAETKNQLWEANHFQITDAIAALIREKGRIPYKSDIAERTGLSRQTVSKHMKEFAKHPQYIEEMSKFRLLSSKILAMVYQYAIHGDMKAAKLFLSTVGLADTEQKPEKTAIQNQNNYIQINGLEINQSFIGKLTDTQRQQIEAILKEAGMVQP
jgi:biotin operon repressor